MASENEHDQGLVAYHFTEEVLADSLITSVRDHTMGAADSNCWLRSWSESSCKLTEDTGHLSN